MSGPHRNHVEARASREPARQFVAESHDHKPDAPGAERPDFFLGTSYSVDQLAIDQQRLMTSFRSLRMAHSARDAAGMKLAAEGAAKLLGQMQALSSHLAKVTIAHLSRRARL